MKRVKRVVCAFSCGANSAVATKIALSYYKDEHPVVITYYDTGSEHPDNVRFRKDCEDWYGQEILVLKSDKYKDIWDVYNKTRFLVNRMGARCTLELKKNVANKFQEPGDLLILGYHAGEKHRAKRFKNNNPEINVEFPLINTNTHDGICHGMLIMEGIELPAMYKMGYKNNNCIGCVKGAKGYWNKIRVDFPEVFERMAKMERELGTTINTITKDGELSRVYLDELPKNAGNYKVEEGIQCGLFCQNIFDEPKEEKKWKPTFHEYQF